MDLEARMTELEIAHAHHERTIAELNSVVIDQEGRIARLSSEIDRLKEQVAALLESEPADSARPPHY
jgi:uncharacterized coiled-coil protein SlyX